MATAVLRHQDPLGGRFGLSAALVSSSSNPNCRTNASRSRRRKRSPADNARLTSNREERFLSSSPPVEKFPSKGLVMGQVKILKRGEELKPPSTMTKKIDGGEDVVLCSTDRLGPDPEVVQKQIRLSDLYAGSAAFLPSPPPSSLPFPAALIAGDIKMTCYLMRCGSIENRLKVGVDLRVSHIQYGSSLNDLVSESACVFLNWGYCCSDALISFRRLVSSSVVTSEENMNLGIDISVVNSVDYMTTMISGEKATSKINDGVI
ncbi:hypothetical protein Ancab_006746 [Ancistrocladus abbreviatus]